jgi:energy-coupling factor transport system ATP-binding protein
VSVHFEPAEMVAVVGDNGSGKSTLTRILAGRAPTDGEVDRPGPAGLGRPGGTAVVLQHPETQVLGVRVADDVVWGMPEGEDVDVEGLLGRVGLAGMGQRETSGLSGGELQRLAVAAALARRPRLVVSDESTAMVDQEGRRLLTDLLGSLARSEGMAVVHVTHRREEAEQADRLYRLGDGLVVGASSGPDGGLATGGAAGGGDEVVGDRPVAGTSDVAGLGISEGGPGAGRVLRVSGVSHTYAIGTPWAKTALSGVDLEVSAGDGLLIVGGNGSGKSTLAWIMAGLLRPTYGACTLDGTDVSARIGSVSLAFQHARLQLQRATVGADIKAAGAAALEAVGLDPGRFAGRRVDELSGGEQRRVALAGLLSRRPAVLLLDEPMAGLDAPSRSGLIGLLSSLRHDHSLTVVVISHDNAGMERICDRVVTLVSGRIVSDTSVREMAL